ncbi:hypothetical protein OKW43_000048 [Paraburkholderia sp. WC7.3g]|uniref:hypothetical protein n=1 Tax=Paraburkholderia sp. WC7.3g TaxID=2991070 RepID=UPI003D2024C7
MAKAKHTLSLDVQSDLFYKRCSQCSELKPFDQFSPNGAGKWKSHCKPCGSRAAQVYAQANHEKVSTRLSLAYRSNIEKFRKKRAEQYWKNPEASRAATRQWAKDNPGRHKLAKRTSVIHRRLTIRQVTPFWANRDKMSEFYFAADFLGMVTGEWHHVDHIVPILGPKAVSGPFAGDRLVCGLHCEANLQVIPGAENMSKGNKFWPDMP